MSTTNPRTNGGLSLDAYAVIVAFLLALAVKLGLLSQIPW